jgi:hypothetical protein
MPPVTKPCPGCRRPLLYRPDAGGRVCCPECGHVIWLTNRAGPPTLPTTPAPRAHSWAAQVVVDGRTVDLQAEQEKTAAAPAPQPLGPEPAPASYGLLQGAAYAGLFLGILTGINEIVTRFRDGPSGSFVQLTEVGRIAALVGLAAFVGSIASIFLGFRGGRGVSTSVGVWIGLAPAPVGISILVFVLVMAFSLAGACRPHRAGPRGAGAAGPSPTRR